MIENEKARNKLLYFLIAILTIYLIIRLIDQSKLISTFPLDYTNDISSHIADLFFLKECGFHNLCSYWYNGFTVLLSYPPGWYFFTYPIYILFNNILLSTYLSMVLLYLLGFLLIFAIGKSQKFSVSERVAFFLLFFANPIAIGNFIRLGRVTELFGWVSFITLAYIVTLYKNKDFGWKFIFFIPAYAIVMMSHFTTMVFANVLVFSFFLIKRGIKDKLIVILSVLFSLLLISFWFLPFLLNLNNTSIFYFKLSNEVLNISLTSLAAIITSIALWILLYFYLKSSNLRRKELIFFIPILIINILFLFDLVNFIPILRDIYTDSYIYFFLFFTLYLFFKVRLNYYPNILKKIIFLFLILIPISFILLSALYTSWFVDYGKLELDTLEVFPYVNNRFVILDSGSGTSYSKAYYSYAPIFHKLLSAGGWKDALIDREYINLLADIDKYARIKDCDNFVSTINKLNSTEVIGYKHMDQCNFLNSCGLNLKRKNDSICLYKL